MEQSFNQFNSIIEFLSYYSDNQKCVDHLERIRWNGNVVSPFDEDSKVYKCKNNRYKCKSTGKYFTVKTGTLFENSKINLQKWFTAIWMNANYKKGISSLQLSRDLGVTQKTAWFMLHRIRNCFQSTFDNKISGEIEVDETYIGGKEGNKHLNKRSEKTTGRTSKSKTPIFGMLHRDEGIRAQIVDNVGAFTLRTIIWKNIEKGSTIFSDEWNSYKKLGDMGYNHQKIVHSSGEYAKGKVHTNTIEGFWSLLKRGIVGIYHFTSKQHLQKYVDEFAFRYNTRESSQGHRFNLMLGQIENRLKYKELISLK